MMPVPGEQGFRYTAEEKQSLDIFLAHYGDTPEHRRLWRKRKIRDEVEARKRAANPVSVASLGEQIAAADAALAETYDPKRDAAFLKDATRALEAQYKARREQRLIADFIAREARRNLFVEGVREAIRPIEYPAFAPLPFVRCAPTLPNRIIAGVWSDLHTGKRTASYNEHVLHDRLDQCVAALIELAVKESADATVEECHLLILGDMVDGANIYPTQPYHSEQHILNQIFRSAAPLLADAIRHIATNFERVVIATVPGNHGRTSKFHHEEDNADNYLYETLRLMTASIPNIRWKIEPSWYQIHHIFDTPILLTHGHQHKIAYSVPFYSLTRKALGWHVAMPEEFDLEVIGHFHCPADIMVNDLRLLINGAFVSDDDFALETLAAKSAPCQTLLVFDERRGLVQRTLVHFD